MSGKEREGEEVDSFRTKSVRLEKFVLLDRVLPDVFRNWVSHGNRILFSKPAKKK